MLNLLALPNPAPTVTRMAELGVLAVVLPEAEVGGLTALVAEEARQEVAPDPLRRLAALLPAGAELAGQIAARFRLSGAQKKRLTTAAGRILPGTGRGTVADGDGGGGSRHNAASLGAANPLHHAAHGPPPRSGEDLDARTLAYRLGLTQALDRLLLTGQSIAPLTGWTIPTLPLKGGEIVAHGVKAGPEVARILKTVEARWIAAGFPDNIDDLLAEELAK